MASKSSKKSRLPSSAKRTTGRQPGVASDRSLAIFEQMWREVLAKDARAVERERDPLQAEVMASGLVRVLTTMELAGEPDWVTAIGRQIVRGAARTRSPEAEMFLLALAAVAPRPLARAAKAALAAGTPWPSARDPESWQRTIGTAQPTGAWRASDLCGDVDSLVVGFRYSDGREHCLLVLVDHLLGGIAKDVALVEKSVDKVLGEWHDLEGADVREEAVPCIAAMAIRALDISDMTIDAPVTEDLEELEALLRARFDPLAKGVPEPATLDGQECEELVRAFLADPAGERFAHDPDAWFLLDSLIDYRCGQGGDPLRWSAAAAELFLLHWVPRKLSAEEETLARAPEVLSAWVPWAAARSGLPDSIAGQTMRLVAEIASEAADALRDRGRWGPAKRAVMQMRDDGVDILDQAAVAEWIANERTERLGVA